MRITRFIFVFVLSVLVASAVLAQDGFENLPPLPAAAMDEGAPIRLNPEGPAVIKLEQDAASVIVGNPTHASAILENPRLIMLMPQIPGATKLMVLDKSGRAILNRHVLVGGGKAQYMRINKICSTSQNPNCLPVAMYYCPDRCYATALHATEGGVATGAGAAYAPPAASGTESQAASPDIPDSVGENPISIE
jgi:hypothetical protein